MVSFMETTLSNLRQRMATWWVILRIALEERLVYRGDFALGTLMRFLPIITQIFLWRAVFDAVAVSGRQVIVGYRFEDVVAYYLLTMVARAFSSMPGLASGIAASIRNGDVKKFLIQPVDMLAFLLLSRVAHKLAYYSVAVGPFALVFFLCRNFFVDGCPALEIWVAFVLSLILSFLLGFFLEASIGLLGFWFLEVSSLLFVYMLLNFFLSGHMFPLDMLPPAAKIVVDWLPFKYVAYFPAAVFLGKLSPEQVAWGLATQATWVVAFVVVARWTWNRGVRRYSAYGG
jgi:ABC-2 type transport system permease protein